MNRAVWRRNTEPHFLIAVARWGSGHIVRRSRRKYVVILVRMPEWGEKASRSVLVALPLADLVIGLIGLSVLVVPAQRKETVGRCG